MVQLNFPGEVYFSRVLDKPIYDSQGRVVGHLKDMAVRWDSNSPWVTGVKYARGIQDLIDINQIDQWDRKSLRLKGKLEEANVRKIQDDEIYIGKWLLDRQIIDFKNSKLVRVSDIKFSRVDHGETNDILLVAVDIGLRGLFRRIGVDSFKKYKSNFLSWENLQLSQDEHFFNRLHQSDININNDQQ